MVEIGVLGRPHGVRGALRVHLHNPSSDLLERIDELLLVDERGLEARFAVLHYQQAPRHGLMVLDGVDTRERALELKGARLFVERGELPALRDGEFYVRDLIGLDVVVGEEVLGVISGSLDRGGVEVVLVAAGDEEIEIPLADRFVEELDVAGRRLRVRDVGDLPRSKARAGRAPGKTRRGV